MQVTVYDERGNRIRGGIHLRDIIDPTYIRSDGTYPIYPGMKVYLDDMRMWIKWVGGYMIDENGLRFSTICVSRKRQKVKSLHKELDS